MRPGFVSATERKVTGRPTSAEAGQSSRERRIPHRVPCRVTIYDAESGRSASLVGQTTNMSRSGLALQLGRHVPEGTSIEALVPHLNSNPTSFRGTVVHSQRVLADTYEIGIEFEAT